MSCLPLGAEGFEMDQGLAEVIAAAGVIRHLSSYLASEAEQQPENRPRRSVLGKPFVQGSHHFQQFIALSRIAVIQGGLACHQEHEPSI